MRVFRVSFGFRPVSRIFERVTRVSRFYHLFHFPHTLIAVKRNRAVEIFLFVFGALCRAVYPVVDDARKIFRASVPEYALAVYREVFRRAFFRIGNYRQLSARDTFKAV